MAGSLSAITVAFAISKLGFTGTLIGAGIGSVIGTFGTALYKNSLDKSQVVVSKILPAKKHQSNTETVAEEAAISESSERAESSSAQGDKLVWWKQVAWKPLFGATVLAMAVAMSTLSFLETRIPDPNQGMTIIYEAQEESEEVEESEESEDSPTIVYIEKPVASESSEDAVEEPEETVSPPLPSASRGNSETRDKPESRNTEELEEPAPEPAPEPEHTSNEESKQESKPDASPSSRAESAKEDDKVTDQDEASPEQEEESESEEEEFSEDFDSDEDQTDSKADSSSAT